MNSLRTSMSAVHAAFALIPYTLVALLARFSVAGVFWRSGQTKVEGFEVDLVRGRLHLGVPRLSENAVALFRDEYMLPLLQPEFGALLAAIGEHALPVLLLLGLATRWSAAGLLAMTAVIQLLVYPGAWPTHGTWAALLLMLMALGPGALSLDRLLARSVIARKHQAVDALVGASAGAGSVPPVPRALRPVGRPGGGATTPAPPTHPA